LRGTVSLTGGKGNSINLYGLFSRHRQAKQQKTADQAAAKLELPDRYTGYE